MPIPFPISPAMKKFALPLYPALSVFLLFGCALSPPDSGDADKGPPVEVDEVEPVTGGDGRRAVLSLHKRYAAADACTFGLTLTNRLPYKITNIAFRFAARPEDTAFHRQVASNFFEIDPGKDQYREISFPGIPCDKIGQLRVTDPGRCALGDLERLSSRPGDCIRRVRIAASPYVKLVRK